MRYLTPFNAAESDGCTLAPYVPVQLRRSFQDCMVRIVAGNSEVARLLREACVMHDLRYYYGGTKYMRLQADRKLRRDMKRAGAPAWFCSLAYRCVRTWGGPRWRQEGVSWSYGGSFFRYGEAATPRLEIVRQNAIQASEVGLEALFANMWPFQEPRCDCPDFTMVFPWKDDFDDGVFCGVCRKTFTRRRLE